MSWKPGKLARNTVIMAFGMGVRAVAQAVIVVITARILGVEGFGSFVAVLSIAGTLSGLSGLGAHVILVRDVACDPGKFRQSWGQTLMAFFWGVPVVVPLFFAMAWGFLPDSIPWTVISLIGIGELILNPLANTGTYAYQGFERIGAAAIMQLSPVLFRLLGAVMLLVIVPITASPNPLVLWSCLYTGTTFASLLFIHHRVANEIGRPIFPNILRSYAHLKESTPFSFWGIADKFYVDADKFMLARFASLSSAGVYSAGYRFVEMAFLPLHALLNAASPRFFRSAQNGILSALSYSRRICLAPLIYAISAGCVLFFAAPILPCLLGKEFEEAVNVIRWLAWLPLVTVPRLLLQYPLATNGLQRTGMLVVIAGACVNLALNFCMIPWWGWRGAVVATYLAEVLMSLLIVRSITYYRACTSRI
ncbi:oligosaccharide flippase family protein [Desulfobulbus sp.]|uniref:oligosaccharide flippase family protein n=1 Tax=Desulfobulbus sp. TaxID=895 RepID=UPI0027B8BD42|nr:oligosaccharide flippase family protein [Desulfobulbus sp.]